MKQLSSIAVINIDGGDRISYTYNEVDENTGELISSNNKRSFYAVKPELREHIEAIRNYIQNYKMEE